MFTASHQNSASRFEQQFATDVRSAFECLAKDNETKQATPVIWWLQALNKVLLDLFQSDRVPDSYSRNIIVATQNNLRALITESKSDDDCLRLFAELLTTQRNIIWGFLKTSLAYHNYIVNSSGQALRKLHNTTLENGVDWRLWE